MFSEGRPTGAVGPGFNGVSFGFRGSLETVAPGPLIGSCVKIPFDGKAVRIV